MSISEHQRDDLRTELKAIDDASIPILKLMEPFREALANIEEVRSMTLLRYGLSEYPATCEGCDCFILPGDNYHACSDGPYLCEDCAPTYGDIKRQIEEPGPSEKDADEIESDREAIQAIEARAAAGGSLDDKAVSVME